MSLIDCIANSRAWSGGQVVDTDLTSDELRADLGRHELVWVDLLRPDRAALHELVDLLDLAPTVVDDILSPHERPKVTRHGESLFFTVYATVLDQGQLRTLRISAIQYQTALITLRLDDAFDIVSVLRRWEDNPALLMQGVGALTHGLLDFVVDSHFDTIQTLDDRLEEMEDELFLERRTHRGLCPRSL
ncbi:MAG: CorA family divalent cation transporter [Nocardioidaceae bacterium]